MISHRQGGQILILQVIGLFLVAAIFLHTVRVAEGLRKKQESQFTADLVALSGAQVEAEVLQFIGVMNQVMLTEARLLMATLAAPLVAAASIIGLPLVPHLVRLASQAVPRLIKSLLALNQFQRQLIRLYPTLITFHVWKIARANGFSGALPASLPKLPVKPQVNKFIEDTVNLFEEGPFKRFSPSSALLRKLLQGKEPDVSPTKTKDPKKNKQVDQAFGKWRKLFKKISPQKLFSAHYLDGRWAEDQINVICWNDAGQLRVSSARVTHNTLPRETDVSQERKNNYITRSEANESSGFQTELCAFPDVLKKISFLNKQLENMNHILKTLPIDIPLKDEHFKWIQH